jgi:hypothetical protein
VFLIRFILVVLAVAFGGFSAFTLKVTVVVAFALLVAVTPGVRTISDRRVALNRSPREGRTP